MSIARAQAIADHQFGRVAGSPNTVTAATPDNWYVGLSTTVPTDDGSNFTEPSGMAYTRVQVGNTAANWPAATTTSGVVLKANGAKITFPNPTGSWGAIQAYGIFVTATGGVPAFFNLLDSPITVQNGNTPVEFDIGQLQMTFGA